jgi:hypothetical protein
MLSITKSINGSIVKVCYSPDGVIKGVSICTDGTLYTHEEQFLSRVLQDAFDSICIRIDEYNDGKIPSSYQKYNMEALLPG